MAIINANSVFLSKKYKTLSVVKIPRNVMQALQVVKAYENGCFQIEPKEKMAMYDSCYIFEDINYINQNEDSQENFLLQFMDWLNSMNVEFKITLANEYQSKEEFLQSVRNEKNADKYPQIKEGIRAWQNERLKELNPTIQTFFYLTVTTKADTEENARIYLNAIDFLLKEVFESWGSKIVKLDAKQRLLSLHHILQPFDKMSEDALHLSVKSDDISWKKDILPRSIEQYKNFLIMGDLYVCVLFAKSYRQSIETNTFLHALKSTNYPSFITIDFTPVMKEAIVDKLMAAQVNTERGINAEIDKKRSKNRPGVPTQTQKRVHDQLERSITKVINNDENGMFVNFLMVITAPDENTLAERLEEVQAVGKKEGVYLETCDFTQLKSYNTALPIGGRQVDYARFFLNSSSVAFQPFHAQDVMDKDGMMLGINRTTRNFIYGDRKLLPNPHGLIVGFSGTGKSMYIKLTEISQTLLSTDEDIIMIDPQNECEEMIKGYGGSYFDLTPQSGTYLNGFEVSESIMKSDDKHRNEYVASQVEYAKALCGAIMKNINVTQEHDSVIGKCTNRMYEKVLSQKKIKKQPTLVMLRNEIKVELEQADNTHDKNLIRTIYNSLEEYTEGKCNMLSKPSNISMTSRLTGFGMSNVSENNWEAVMVTVLHYLENKIKYNRLNGTATHFIIDEAQVVAEKPGSAKQLTNAVLTYRKVGGIVTLAMQNVTAAISNRQLRQLYANCAYKVFFDQGGVDARNLSEIQTFTDKEFRALSESRIGHGVMVWGKKVVLFDALINKKNTLYKTFTTNFHEKAEKTSRQMEESVPTVGTTTLAESVPTVGTKQGEKNVSVDGIKRTAENEPIISMEISESQLEFIQTLEQAAKVTVDDLMCILGKDRSMCEQILTYLQKHNFFNE